MFKLNSFCRECLDPFKIVWNCKIGSDDREWVYLCYNCIRYYKYINGKKFKSQFQNIKSIIRCTLKSSKLKLPFYNYSPSPKDTKTY